MWADPTGLYHARARQYDPASARFLSRDDAEGEDLFPESWHPYQFAFANPRVYRDPTGLISLADISAALTVRNVLEQVAKRIASKKAIKHIKGEIIDAIVDLLVGRITKVLPFGNGPTPVGSRKAGFNFEAFIGDKVCDLFGGLGNGGKGYFWREVGVNQSTGKARGGTPCGEVPSRKGVPSRGHSFPDFLVTPVAPDKIEKKRITKKSWLVAEAKLSGNNIKTRGPRARQLETILLHSKEWSASRIVLYMSFNKVRASKVRTLKRIAGRYKSKLFLFSIL